MDTNALQKQAEELEKTLAPKLGKTVKVGWKRSSGGNVVFIVFLTERVSTKVIPDTWYGGEVRVQRPRIEHDFWAFVKGRQIGQ